MKEEGYTCVLCKGEALYTSRERGVKPLLELLNAGTEFSGFSAADKVVGKATAFLYVLLGVTQVYTPVVSKAAEHVLERYKIALQADARVEAIFNHRRDGFCPMETATKDIEEPEQALAAIRLTLQKMNANKK